MSRIKEGTLQELSARLFEQMDAIQNPDLEGDALAAEIERSKVVIGISKNIVDVARVMVEARVAWDNKVTNIGKEEAPKLLALEKNEKVHR